MYRSGHVGDGTENQAPKRNSGMTSRRHTSYDVAKLAGVSQSAVSRVFSPSGSASPEMRDKILRAAKKLNYKPNAIAQSLSYGRTRIIGMIITHFSNQIYPVPLNAVTGNLMESGESVLLQIAEPGALGDDAVQRLLRYRVDAIVCTSDLSEQAIAHCIAEKVPIVLVNRKSSSPHVDHVVSDNFESSQRVALGLASSGVVKTLFLKGPESNWVAQLRYKGYQKGCREAGMPRPLTADGQFTYEGGYETAMKYSDRIGEIDAIVSANDTMAIGAIDALVYEMGLSIPGDVRIVGHNDSPEARLKPYQLTTIRQPMDAMLKKATELALQRIENPDLPSTDIIMASELVLRKSAVW